LKFGVVPGFEIQWVDSEGCANDRRRSQWAMTLYRCYLVDKKDRFAAVEDIEAETDHAAIEAARRVMAERPRKTAFELWELGRQVHIEPLEGA
jgi:hypothetical protein